MSSFSNTTNFDNLLLQSLMGRLQLRPSNNPLLSQSLEDLLFDAANNLSDDDENDENKSQLAKEESKLEKEIIRVILSGKTDSLKPNSGQAVTIGEHHICVGFHEEKGSDYRVWEWHGHIMLFDEENGYTPEYIYGNYFERLLAKAGSGVEEVDSKEEEKEEKVGNLGLRELIDGGDSSSGRILHRNMNVGSPSGVASCYSPYLVFFGSCHWCVQSFYCPFSGMVLGKNIFIIACRGRDQHLTLVKRRLELWSIDFLRLLQSKSQI